MFSFKINKKSGSATNPVQKSSQQLPKSKKAFNDDDDAEEDEPDFIDGLDGNKIVSKKKAKKVEKKELVIPLISKNEWRIDKNAAEKRKDKENSLGETNNESEGEGKSQLQNVSEEDSLKQQAIKELLEGQSSKESDKDKNRSIPILFQNRVPDGYEEEDNMDVSLRPDQSTLDDYDRIPIEDFGLAMLRGMGWKETEGIGLKNKKVVNMAEPKLRPKGMGLGAEAAHMNMAPANVSHGKEEKEDLSLKIGGYGKITKEGSKKGYYGQIESFDEDNNRVILRLAISGKMEAVSKFSIEVVSAEEYKKSSKVINREKYEEFKSKQESKQNNNGDDREYRESNGTRQSRSESEDDEPRNSRSRSRRDNRDADYDNLRDSRSRSRRDDRDRDDDYDVEPRDSRNRSGREDRKDNYYEEPRDSRNRSRKEERNHDYDEEPRDSKNRTRRDDREDDNRSSKKERKSSRKDRDRSRDRNDDKYDRHSSRKYDDKRHYDDNRSSKHRHDDYENSSKYDDRDKSDYRHKSKKDRDYDRR